MVQRCVGNSVEENYGIFLQLKFVHTLFGANSFIVAAPTIWNSLPLALQMCISPDTFRHHLKTHRFQQASNPLSAFLLHLRFGFWLTIVCVYKFYLLTYLHQVSN